MGSKSISVAVGRGIEEGGMGEGNRREDGRGQEMGRGRGVQSQSKTHVLCFFFSCSTTLGLPSESQVNSFVSNPVYCPVEEIQFSILRISGKKG
jgi:hypothetical protein